MSMGYGIKPMLPVDGAYVWRFETRTKAMDAAKELSDSYRVSVIVFNIIGEYQVEARWVEHSDVD